MTQMMQKLNVRNRAEVAIADRALANGDDAAADNTSLRFGVLITPPETHGRRSP